ASAASRSGSPACQIPRLSPTWSRRRADRFQCRYDAIPLDFRAGLHHHSARATQEHIAVSSKEKKPETIAVSAGRMTKEHYGAVNTPVYRTSTILHPSFESLKTEALPYKYGRRGTPTSRS